MRVIFKILTVIIITTMSANSCMAFSASKIEKLIDKSSLNETSTIAISIRNTSNNNVVFEKNANKLLHPASTLKLITTYFAVNTLGYDYFFKTGFYTDSNNNLYIKLGADPMLSTSQLKTAFQALKEKNLTTFNNLYIDDSIIDKKEFSNGWMWDDDVNSFTPKVSAYNLDGNTIKVNMSLDNNGIIKTSSNSKYPMSVFSYITKDTQNDFLDINRYNWNSPEVVEIYGYLTKSKSISIPISSMRRYFIYNLDKILEDNRITIKSTLYSSQLVPQDAKQVYEIVNPMKPAIRKILHNSNNLMSETIFKLAGGHKYNSTGTDELAVYAMNEFYKEKTGVDFDPIIIKDGCGVSRNNLVSVNWMTNILDKIYKDKDFEKFQDYMAQSGDGTLSSRLYDLRGEAWLKTGSLSNISAIAGYIKSQDGNTYSVTIFTQNFKEKQQDIKKFEDEIITLIYNR